MKSGVYGYKPAVILFLGGMLLSCSSAYYRTMEAFGVHKRDLLVKRVEQARDSQEEAGEQFQSALEKFSELMDFEGGELQEKYEQLNDEYEDSRARADDVSVRIDSMQQVAEDLFAEWEDELDEYTSDKLRRSSERTLRKTRRKYEDLIDAMRKAESKMPPVLARLKDQVLFLKHNLNARAIASLEGTAEDLRAEIDQLIEELENAIAEANEFIEATMTES